LAGAVVQCEVILSHIQCKCYAYVCCRLDTEFVIWACSSRFSLFDHCYWFICEV